jgi:hypothetical protein
VTLHLVKLCVGCDSIEDLRAWHREKSAEAKRRGRTYTPRHWTRMMPTRRDEILDGGSLYWVIQGFIAVRQRIVGVDRKVDADGRPVCRLSMTRRLIPVEPRARGPFQGWRYLEPEAAPPDLKERYRAGERLPPARMLAELRQMGLI